MTPISLPSIPERTGPCHDHEALLQRVAGDEDTVRELLALFIEDIEVRCVALEEAVAEEDAARVVAAAHSARGMLLVFSAGYSAGVAAAIETAARAGELDGLAPLIARLRAEVRALIAEISGCLSPSATLVGGAA